MPRQTPFEKIINARGKEFIEAFTITKVAETAAKIIDNMDKLTALGIGALAERGNPPVKMAYRAMETLLTFQLSKSPNTVVSTAASLKFFANLAAAGLQAAGVPQLHETQFPWVDFTPGTWQPHAPILPVQT